MLRCRLPSVIGIAIVRWSAVHGLCVALAIWLAACSSERDRRRPDVDWAHHAGDPGGRRYSAARVLDVTNVTGLRTAWTARLDGDSIDSACLRCVDATVRAEQSPVVSDGRMFVSTPRGRVVSLDAATGVVHWRYDAKLDAELQYREGLTTRGLSVWRDSLAVSSAPCAVRVLATFPDASLHAVDAESGEPCGEFGVTGRLDLRSGVSTGAGTLGASDYSVTSPPVVIRGLVIVGSTLDGNLLIPRATGAVRAFDARTGRLRWSFDPIPRTASHPAWSHWDSTTPPVQRGGANVWAPISADDALSLVFLPTASAAPAHIGVSRPGSNPFANSIVALEASTGRLVWAFQLVRHDLWDYDVATQPIVTWMQIGNRRQRVVIAMSKAGHVFVLDARDGTLLSPAAVTQTPTSTVSGERASTHQLAGVGSAPLAGGRLTIDSIGGVTPGDRRFCEEWWKTSDYDGPFTPPSERGSILWPGVWGGPNWDGSALDPRTGVLYVTVRRIASIVKLHRRNAGQELPSPAQGEQRFAQSSPDWIVRRMPFVAPSGVPCTPPPWGLVAALHLPSGRLAWQRPLGDAVPSSWGPTSWRGGDIVFGGPLSTEGGLVFVAATRDDSIRALRSSDGRVLWAAKLPAGGQASPISYEINGTQYIAISAGGRAGVGSRGDYLVAFTLGGRVAASREPN